MEYLPSINPHAITIDKLTTAMIAAQTNSLSTQTSNLLITLCSSVIGLSDNYPTMDDPVLDDCQQDNCSNHGNTNSDPISPAFHKLLSFLICARFELRQVGQ